MKKLDKKVHQFDKLRIGRESVPIVCEIVSVEIIEKMKDRQKILSITKDAFRWDYYKGSGCGGQKRNKTENCCRCTHEPSGAVGKSEEGRSKEHNRKTAFRRMAESEKFQRWLRIEVARRTGEIAQVERKVERDMENIRVEVRSENGTWVLCKKESA